MKFEFKLGVVSTTFLLINIHMFIISLMFIGAHQIESLYFILNITAMAYAAITVLGHVRASWACMSKMNEPDVLGKPLEDPTSLKEALDLRRNPTTLGLMWRFKKEWEYIKKTASFDFKFE